MRPLVQFVSGKTGKATGGNAKTPRVFAAPIRDDIVRRVFTMMSRNKQQPYAVDPKAGHRHSAESWGTGRAVSRIPRVSGGGTHAAGQGAFGNMCRGGHLFGSLNIWRRWHRKINITEKRVAVMAAVAATAVAPLVWARGHRIGATQEIPLVVDHATLADVKKTKEAVQVLKKVGGYADVLRVKESRALRAGQGKARNRRYRQRTGPMLVLPNSKDSKPIARAFRNIPGLDTAVVTRLNLLRLAPGGHLGRFVIWDSEAFKQLDKVFSNKMKKGLKVPRAKLTQASIMRIMKSAEVRKVLRKRKFNPVLRIKKNPLKNFGAMLKLNPYAAVPRRAEILRMRKIAAAKKTLELQRANKIPKPAEKKPKKERKVKKLSKNVLVLKNGKVEKVPRKVKKTPPAKKPKADKPKPKLKHVKAAKAAPKGILGDRMRKAQKKAVKKSKLYRQRKAFAKLLLA